MRSSEIFTRQRMKLDISVWLSMITVIVLSCGLFAYKMIDKSKIKPCTPFDITINGLANSGDSTYNVDESLLFKGNIPSGDEIIWYFGDNTKKQEGFITSHTFKQTGNFVITATINDNCVSRRKINIIKPEIIIRDSSGNIAANIIGSDEIPIGENATFYTLLPASSYVWTIENNNYYQPRNGKQTAFKFKTAGIYTIMLVLDNDRQKTFRKNVVVNPADANNNDEDESLTKLIPSDYYKVSPKKEDSVVNQNLPAQNQSVQSLPAQNQTVQKPPEEKTIEKRGIGAGTFKGLLENLVLGKMECDKFNQYFLCLNLTAKNVYVNGGRKPVSFSDFCQQLQLQSQKKGTTVEIASAEIKRDDPDNPDCETRLNIGYTVTEKKLILFKKKTTPH